MATLVREHHLAGVSNGAKGDAHHGGRNLPSQPPLATINWVSAVELSRSE